MSFASLIFSILKMNPAKEIPISLAQKPASEGNPNPSLGLFEQSEDNVSLGNDEDNISDGETEHSEHNTESEQSDDDNENGQCPISLAMPSGQFYIGKDGKTKWSMIAPSQNVKSKTKQGSRISGVTKLAKEAKSIEDCWKLLFSKDIIDDILDCTNAHINAEKSKYERQRDCKEASLEELYALFGILYMAGVNQAQHQNLEELYADDGSAPECFKATMSIKRLQFLLRFLTFDTIEDRSRRKETDNLAAIRNIFEKFVTNCQSYYQIGEYCTVDEMLESFRGKCKFRVYMGSKSARYGIKIYAMVDSQSFYTYNLEVYTGKNHPPGSYKVDTSPESVVKRLIAPIANTRRNVTVDNHFTSIHLADELSKMKTTLIGTLQKTKKEIPPQFLNLKNRSSFDTLFGFRNDSVLVSYKASRQSIVLILSTLLPNDKTDESNGQPEIINYYNLTKGGVEIVEELKSLYTVSRKSGRWPLTVFFGLMNIGGINSNIIYEANTGDKLQRRIYLKQLALGLMKPLVVVRSSIATLPAPLKESIKKMMDDKVEEKRKYTEGFCAFCPRRKNIRTKKRCNTCNIQICPRHTIMYCQDCDKLNISTPVQ